MIDKFSVENEKSFLFQVRFPAKDYIAVSLSFFYFRLTFQRILSKEML